MTLIETAAICEAKVVHIVGLRVWTALSARDLIALTESMGDLRGFAVGREVFVWPAYDETHFGAAGPLGIEHDMDEGDFNSGGLPAVPFLCYSSNHPGHTEARDDWDFGEPEFQVGPVSIQVQAQNLGGVKVDYRQLLRLNPQFMRMIKPI